MRSKILAATAAVGGVLLAVLAFRYSRRSLGEIHNLEPEDRKHISSIKLYDFEQRMRAAGAQGKLSYVGAGAEGFVACDDHGKAYKASWQGQEGLADEARWFQMAAKIPSIKQHVPKFVRWNDEENVLVRECLVPRTARSGRIAPNSKRLWELHQRLTSVMAPYGYGRPEFKVDAYVYTKRGPVLVDAGFAANRGRPLVKEVLATLKRDQITARDAEDAAFALRMERDSTIPAPIANKLLTRLKARDPRVEID